jgi:hypothetical protein
METDNNFSYGADGIFRIFGDDYVNINIAQTTDSVGKDMQTSLDPTFFSVSWERRSQKGLAYDFSYSYAGKDFDPQVGFMSRYGVKGGRYRVQYGWLPGNGSKFFNYSAGLSYYSSYRVIDNGLDSGIIGPYVSFVTKSGWVGRLNIFYSKQGVDEEFELDDNVVVPVNFYKYITSRSTISTPKSKPISAEFNITAGEFYDGNNFTVSSEPIFNLSSSIQISGYYNFNHVVFPTRNQESNSHVARIKLLYMHDTKLSVSSFIQFNSLNSLAVANFRLRYNPKEGNDLYLVYNETRPTSGFFDENIAPVDYLNRIIQIKYIHTFRL